MARLINKLAPLAVSKATKPGYYGDGEGLWLQVSPSGSKSWVFRFTLAGKRREMGLGAVHAVSLPEARAKAKECRLLLLEGKDPLEARNASKLAEALERAKMMTFDHCAAAYIAAHRSGWKNPKHASQWENTIATYASPIIGKLPVAQVDIPRREVRQAAFRHEPVGGIAAHESRRHHRAWLSFNLSRLVRRIGSQRIPA